MSEDAVPIAEFSHIVGAIYDCALDPKRWPIAIREICAATRCQTGIMAIHDFGIPSARVQEHWNYDPDGLAKIETYADDLAELWSGVADLHARPIDEPLTIARDVPPEHALKCRYFQEWALPRGFIDNLALTPLREPHRVGALGMLRSREVGEIVERDIAAARFLAPHVRRALAISDVLNLQAVKIDACEASLDLISAGIVLVDGEAKVVHANRSAEAMLRRGAPIRAHQGELRTNSAESSAALKAAVAQAPIEGALGKSGIGLPAPQEEGAPALIHVLPLTSGERRARIAPKISAALFVTTAQKAAPSAQSLAALFDLTPTETRVADALLAGKTPAETAAAMAIAVSTVRTHLAKIFNKTGVSRQAEFIRLAAQFAPPVALP
jgi:DNA-binding CsgD family transcriptional regulator/PAS domain-containing protein